MPTSAPEPDVKTVLVVEDEPGIRRIYQVGLKSLQGFRVVFAENGQAALEVLDTAPVDVLVTDLEMPVMNGYRLIAETYRRFPSVPVIVMTGMDPRQDRQVEELGALRILHKPPRLSALMEAIADAVKPPDGAVRGLGLGSLLQLMNWDQKTCTLTVRAGDQAGHLYLHRGQLIHASLHGHSGIVAAYEMLTWDRPEMEFVETCRVAPTIELPLPEILMNVAMIRDTLGRPEDAAAPPAPQAALPPDPFSLPQPPGPPPDPWDLRG